MNIPNKIPFSSGQKRFAYLMESNARTHSCLCYLRHHFQVLLWFTAEFSSAFLVKTNYITNVLGLLQALLQATKTCMRRSGTIRHTLNSYFLADLGTIRHFKSIWFKKCINFMKFQKYSWIGNNNIQWIISSPKFI